MTKHCKSKVRLTDRQIDALRTAYVPDYQLELTSLSDWHEYGGDLAHPRTVQSLLHKGLVETVPDEPEDPDDMVTCQVTQLGRQALGVVFARKPRTLKSALRQAIKRHAPWLAASDIITAASKIPRPIDDDGRRGDYSDAVGAIHGGGDDIIWDVVAAMVSDADPQWRIYADRGRLGIVAFWPVEDE